MKDEVLRERHANDWLLVDRRIVALHERIDATQLEIKTLLKHLGLEWETGPRLKCEASPGVLDTPISCPGAFGLPPGCTRTGPETEGAGGSRR